MAASLLTGCATMKSREPLAYREAVKSLAASKTPLTVQGTVKGLDRALTPASASMSEPSNDRAGTPDAPIDPNQPAIPPPGREFAIDLSSALRLAQAENPQIAGAVQMIGEALAIQQKARVIMLPSLNLGASYHDHTGNLQRSSGVILNLNQKSLYFGGGAMPVTAGTVEIPAVSIFSPLTDAIFEPLAAHQHVAVAQFDAATTNNNVLREVAEFHFELIAAEAELFVRRETAMQEAEVARLTRAYADAQQGREADAERAATELSLIEIEVREAEELVAVTAARLSRRLHLDQSVRLRPIAPVTEQVTLIDPAAPLPDLIAVAIQRRPEAQARSAAISEADYRHKQEVFRPLLPTVGMGFSGGVFGGGSNLVGPELAHFGGRTDLDLMAYWTFRNFGFGNLALMKQRRAEIGQAAGEQAKAISLIRSEVSASHAEIDAARNQVGVTTRQLASAEVGFREDLQRIRNTVGRPIEVVNSLELLNHARVDRIRAVLNYNKAQIRLFVALGSPPPVDQSQVMPSNTPPIADPPLPPLDGLVAKKWTRAEPMPVAVVPPPPAY
ncbi:MAG: hypothetical protein ABS79_05605 [Planctomycetes bacterium SCN 63-9]|nr:MAG: hypothetical protein ABS79_05605 [Planctomycetes bacterium SCN 63-9]